MNADLLRARDMVRAARRVVVLTGAGISTDSGIPDFRGPNGLWTRDPTAQQMVTLQVYATDPEVRARTWLARAEHPAWTAVPNPGHLALLDLERTGRLSAVLTQNVDGLHQQAGTSPSLVIELHGTIFDTVCLSCADLRPMRAALDRVAAGDPDPPCLLCGGILKSATISFGQSLDRAVVTRARELATTCDVLLAVGSSLTVQPAAGLVGLASAAGAKVLLCNGSPTPYDPMATTILRTPISTTLPTLCTP